MDTIERYLSAVKTFLPKAQQADIINELSENILAKIEHQEAELGRPLSEAEREALLKQLGHPALVAGRYRTDQGRLAFGRELIGPVLFPLYMRILGLVLALGLAGCLVAIYLVDEPISEMGSTILVQLLVQFGIITLIFSLAQSHLTRHPDAWSPRDPLSPAPILKNHSASARSEALFDLVILIVVLLWLPSLRSKAGSLFEGLTLAPIWGQLYAPVLLLTLASLVPPLVTLRWPAETRLRAALRVALDAVWAGPFLFLLSAGPWLLLPAGSDATTAAPKLELINDSIFYSLLVVLAVLGWQLLVDLRKLWRR